MRLTSTLLGLMLVLGCNGRSRDLSPITIEPIVTMGDEVGDGAMATWPRVSARHPLGYRILVPQPSGVPTLPVVYDDSGKFIGTLGSLGDGRADFVDPLFARLGPGDSIWVFDGSRRAQVFSPEREHVRTVPLPVAPWDAVVLRGGRIALTPALFGQPLPFLVLDVDGLIIRRVGVNDSTSPTPRRIIAGPDGTVWLLSMTHKFNLQQWDLYGNKLREFDTAPQWFEPYSEMQGPDATSNRAPQAAVQDGWVDTDGRIWIVGKVADPNWRDGLGTPVDGSAPITDADKVYDTIVEVHDGETGEVITQSRFDGAYPFSAEAGVLTRVRTSPSGWHRAELVRILVDAERLSRPQ